MGNDVEVMSGGRWRRRGARRSRPFELEHTTPYLWDRRNSSGSPMSRWETGLDYSRSHRLVLDYPEDYQVIHRVYQALWRPHAHFTLAEIPEFLEARPEVAALNAAPRLRTGTTSTPRN